MEYYCVMCQKEIKGDVLIYEIDPYCCEECIKENCEHIKDFDIKKTKRYNKNDVPKIY